MMLLEKKERGNFATRDKVIKNIVFAAKNNPTYYMAKPVLGKSLRSDWFFLGQDFAVRTVSMETVQSRVLLFWSEAGKFKICNQNSEKKV